MGAPGAGALRLLPLGGLGEIGLNAMVLEAGEDRLLIDAGLMFPTDGMPGVGAVYPDFRHLLDGPGALRGILLTHGHEDHIGALPYLLRQLSRPVPVYGAPLTLALVRARLEEHGLDADLREIAPGDQLRAGHAFTAEPIQVAHSVPDAVGFLVHTPAGDVVHTGDFKLDHTPVDGRITDLKRLERAGDEGVLCLLSDSTNAEVEDEAGSERLVADTFERLLTGFRGRVFLTQFASNLQRIRHFLELCARLGRRVALHGRSMVRNVELAQGTGYLPPSEGLLVSLDEALRLPPANVAFLTTGAQAEPRSGLLQLLDDERDLRIQPGDLVVLSARSIPGNERAITRLIDQLLLRGAKVVHGAVEPGVHVTGHATRPQQRQVIELLRPRNVVPIHGELHHLHAHHGLATEVLQRRAAGGGLPGGALLARDGDLIGFVDGRAGLAGQPGAGRVLQDRGSASEVSAEVLRDRTWLGESGVVAVTAVVDRGRSRLLAAPAVVARGLPDAEQPLLPKVAEECHRALTDLSPSLLLDDALVKEELVRAVRRVFKLHSGRRPPVLPQVVKV